jgi:5-methylcytosine-specific restriction endonuclease McrA
MGHYDDDYDYAECDCGRGTYNPNQYRTCYTCYLERRESYESCILCGNWHSPRFAVCFQCRSSYREEAGRNLRIDIMIRDKFTCQNCGAMDNLQVDHIEPCAQGGTANPWNLQVLCRQCNHDKGSEYDWHWEERRIDLMHLYFTFGWSMLNDDERSELVLDAKDFEREGWDKFSWHTHYQPQPPTPQWAIDMADAEAA